MSVALSIRPKFAFLTKKHGTTLFIQRSSMLSLFIDAFRRTCPLSQSTSEAHPNTAFRCFLSSLTHKGSDGPQLRAELQYSALTYAALTAAAADLSLDAAITEYRYMVAYFPWPA